jgi:hypothetical protein
MDFLSALDDVAVGDDQPARIDDHARAERIFDPVARHAEGRHVAEEMTEQRVVE